MSAKETLDVTTDVAKEISKDTYNDVAKPVLKPAGELIGLIPRAIKAALAPLERWILKKEYNVAETKKLLEQKLEQVSPDLIESPEPHIAIPAMQYISYCMDNDKLRDMYASLLANSMNKVVKNGVHPSFVEIIKQLSPDEAKILDYMADIETIPTITLRYENNEGSGINVIKNFSNVGELAECESLYETNKYFNNLIRLGLIEDSNLSSLTDKDVYKPLKEHSYLSKYVEGAKNFDKSLNNVKFVEGYVRLTDFGKSFCTICLNKTIPSIDEEIAL